MANTGRPTTTRRNPNTARTNRGVYVEGNTARRLQEAPARRNDPARHNDPSRRNDPARKAPAGKRVRSSNTSKKAVSAKSTAAASRQTSRVTQRNREKAMSMNRGFVIFLTAVSVAVLFMCVHYLQLKWDLTAQMKTVAALEAQLSELKEENDAYESQVTTNVDLNAIKKIAIGRLGMRYPTDDQKMTYETSKNSYVRQYQDIPDSE